MNSEDWIKKLELDLQEQEENISVSDAKFFHADKLLPAARRVESFYKSCNDCKRYRKELEELAGNLSIYFDGSLSSRRKFDKRLNNILFHLRKRHQVYPAGFFTSYFSFLGMVAGVLLSLLIIWYLPQTVATPIILLGWLTGLIVGRIAGSGKDKQIRAGDRTL